MKLKISILCLLAIFFSNLAFTQQGDAPQQISPFEAIQVLKNGTLVVRLSTNARKIEALEKMVATTTSGKDRLRFEKMLEDTRLETRTYNQWLIEAFDSNYTYSKVIFMPDTAATLLKAGIRKGIFCGPDLQIDPSLSLERGFLVAYYGKSSSSDNSGNDGINVLDENLQPLREPFPSFVGRTSIRRIFEEVFNNNSELDHYTKLVIKFQKRLIEFGG